MSDNRQLSCDQLREIGGELALGVLPANERAAAMDHLERCPACREHVHELALTADALLDLVPGSEPPPGFEDRVLGRLGLPSARRPQHRVRKRRLTLAVAAVAAALALGGVGWVLGTSFGPPAPVTSPSAPAPHQLLTAPLTSDGHAMGQVYTYTGPEPWMFMSVDAPGVSGTVRCQFQQSDGSIVPAGTFTVNKTGDGYYGTAYPTTEHPITSVRLVSPSGSVLATATLDRAPA